MLKHIDFLKIRAERPIFADNDYFETSASEAKRLNEVGQGNHIYLVLSYPRANRHEVVKYTHGQDFVSQGGLVKVPIERGVLGQRLSFPGQVCIRAEWTTLSLKEYIEQVT